MAGRHAAGRQHDEAQPAERLEVHARTGSSSRRCRSSPWSPAITTRDAPRWPRMHHRDAQVEPLAALPGSAQASRPSADEHAACTPGRWSAGSAVRGEVQRVEVQLVVVADSAPSITNFGMLSISVVHEQRHEQREALLEQRRDHALGVPRCATSASRSSANGNVSTTNVTRGGHGHGDARLRPRLRVTSSAQREHRRDDRGGPERLRRRRPDRACPPAASVPRTRRPGRPPPCTRTRPGS